jgi:hypothetical protein
MNYLVTNKKWSNISNYRLEEFLQNTVYSLDWDEFGNIFFKESLALDIPTPLYDVDQNFRKLVLNSFNHYSSNLGVTLSGDKGTGKTVCAKLLAIESKLPVIAIPNRIPLSVDFKEGLNNIKQDVVIFIDEFEKLFADSKDDKFHNQNSFLSLMDGINSIHKKLFIFTVNESISKYLKNRPSRVKYFKNYEGISTKLVEIIIEDLLVNKDFKEDLIKNIVLNECTIDILISIIKEINIHNIPYSEFKDFFNYTIESIKYQVSKFHNNSFVYLGMTSINVYGTDYYLTEDLEDPTLPKDEEGCSEYIPRNVYRVVQKLKDIIVLEHKEGTVIKLEPVKKVTVAYI